MTTSISVFRKGLLILITSCLSLVLCACNTNPTDHITVGGTTVADYSQMITENDTQATNTQATNTQATNTQATNTQATNTEENVPTETMEEITELNQPAKSLYAQTPYGRFLLSGHWIGEMSVDILEGKTYTIRALCQTGTHSKMHLFDVTFGDGEGECMGYVLAADGNYVPVYLILAAVEPDDSWTAEEKQDFYGMQSEVNSILSQLDLVSEIPTEPSQEDAAIEVKTSYFSLYYPAKFAGRIRTEVQEGESVVVSFFGGAEGMEELHLYDIEINSAAEIPVGYYTLSDGKIVALDICNFEEYSMEGWSDEAKQQMNEMLESVNDVLFALEQSGNFAFY